MSSDNALLPRLVQAGIEIVDAEGLEGLTLRALASRAGVSRQAPYLHFASKDALLAALASEGLRREARFVRDAEAETGNDAWQRVLAMAHAHLRLRREHPGLYALAHGRVPKSATEELQGLAADAFAHVRAAIVELCPGIDLPTARQRVMIAWALVRGAAELEGMASTPASVPGDATTWCIAGLEALVAAWRATDG